jgi:hypothetical protein
MNDADDLGTFFKGGAKAESVQLDFVRLRLSRPLSNHDSAKN